MRGADSSHAVRRWRRRRRDRQVEERQQGPGAAVGVRDPGRLPRGRADRAGEPRFRGSPLDGREVRVCSCLPAMRGTMVVVHYLLLNEGGGLM